MDDDAILKLEDYKRDVKKEKEKKKKFLIFLFYTSYKQSSRKS